MKRRIGSSVLLPSPSLDSAALWDRPGTAMTTEHGSNTAHQRPPPVIGSISAVTLGTHDMARAVPFYRALGFSLLYGGEGAAFTSFAVGAGYLNLIAQPE